MTARLLGNDKLDNKQAKTIRMYGALPIRPSDLAKVIRTKVIPKARHLEKALRQIVSEGNHIRLCRTRAVKIILRGEGKRRTYHVFPNTDGRLRKTTHEFLYDLIWWDDRPGKRCVTLAVECEWSGREGGVIYDFEKLLAVKSRLKLFIYQCNSQIKGKRLQSKIAEYLMNYRNHMKGEVYLFCELCLPGETFNCYMFRVNETSYGRVKTVRFRKPIR